MAATLDLVPIDLSILIVTYDSSDEIVACLDSIGFPDGLAGEVVIVDNQSSDDTVATIEAHPSPVRLVVSPLNSGFGAGVNLAAAHAQGAYLLLLNPDAVLAPDCIPRLLELASQRPDATLCGGVTHMSDGTRNPHTIRRLPSLRTLFAFATGWTWVAPPRLRPEYVELPPAGLVEAEMITGSLMLIRRENFTGLNGFDERFFMYGEDTDLCARIVEGGGVILVDTSASITHDGGASTRSEGRKLAMMMAGKVTYLRIRWSGLRRAVGLALVWTGCALRAVAGLVHPGTRRWTDAWRLRSWWWSGYRPDGPHVPPS